MWRILTSVLGPIPPRWPRDLRVCALGDSFVAGVGDPERRGCVGRIVAGALLTEPVRPTDWARILTLVKMVATLDHRHFAAVRPSHVEAFTLLP